MSVSSWGVRGVGGSPSVLLQQQPDSVTPPLQNCVTLEGIFGALPSAVLPPHMSRAHSDGNGCFSLTRLPHSLWVWLWQVHRWGDGAWSTAL